MCHEVLRDCPYYLPSEFQSNDEDGNTFNEGYVYGGYPAFDCPKTSKKI